MRNAGIYLIQVEVSSARSCAVPAGEITITFRVGRSSVSHIFSNPSAVRGELSFNCLLQLNVDSTALQAQRCSLSFANSDKQTVGICLISLPKDKNLVQSTYRITQNEDKRAEVDIRIKISLLDGNIPSNSKAASQHVKSQSSLLNTDSFKMAESKTTPENSLPKIYVNNLLRTESLSSNQPSNIINVKSKISEEYSQVQSDERKPRSFKVREEDKVVQTTESQLKRIKDEKEVYYQLYQIEKGKSEVATRFISNFLKKITEKMPSLAAFITEQQSNESTKPVQALMMGEKKTKSHKQQQQADSAHIAQLEQANRTLHRQVEDYKRLVEQMKLDIIKPGKDTISDAKYTANLILSGMLDLSNSKSNIRENSRDKSKIKSTASIKEPPRPEKSEKPHNIVNMLKQIDFGKWIDLSIGQRQAIQKLLGNLTQKHVAIDPVEKTETCLKKLKGKLDKSFTALITKRQITKEALLNHKKEVNKFFEEILA